MRIKQLLPLFVAASIASSANAALTALLDDISAVFTTSDDPSGSVSNLKNEGETLANVDIGVQYGGGAFIATGSDSDLYGGDTLNSHTLVLNMGSSVTFDAFIHAQRHQAAADSVKTMQFWVTNSDPGTDWSAIASTYFGTPPDASVDVNIGNRFLYSYEFGTTLTGQYVVMRWISNGTANPGGYTFQLATSDAIPEPSTALLGGIGLLSLLRHRRS